MITNASKSVPFAAFAHTKTSVSHLTHTNVCHHTDKTRKGKHVDRMNERTEETYQLDIIFYAGPTTPMATTETITTETTTARQPTTELPITTAGR